MNDVDVSAEQQRRLENEVNRISGAMDWSKVTFTVIAGALFAILVLLVSLLVTLFFNMRGLYAEIESGFAAQSQQQAREVSTIASVITAAKEMQPQIYVLPADAVVYPRSPQTTPTVPPAPTPPPGVEK